MMAEKLKPEGKEYSPETWHTWAKMRFLGAEERKLPNGKTIVVPHSSAELDKDEFHDYVFQVEAFANERGVFLDEMPT